MKNKQRSETRSLSRARALPILCGFLIIAAFFLFTEHRAHVFGILLFVLLLLCPILHFLLHGKHRGHGGDEGQAARVDGRKHGPGGEQ